MEDIKDQITDRNIIFMRHLDEIDDLEQFGRDAPLYESENNTRRVEQTSTLLAQKIESNQRGGIIFVVSPRIRAIQTAELLRDGVVKKLNPENKLKTRISINENLRASEQGEFILPEDYQPGESFDGLKIAGKIFEKENRGENTEGIRNIDYRFGDPVKVGKDNYKYPELLGCFAQYGETYRETLTRMLQTILDLSKKYKKLIAGVEVVIIGHGQTYHIIRGLNIIGQMVNDNSLEFKKGDIIPLLWKIYDQCPIEEKIPGINAPVDFSLFGDQRLMDLLANELDDLKK
jgi:broad specificity phosphatase PhoE